MLANFEELQKLGKNNMDLAMKSFGAMSKGWQAIAAEMAEYSKKNFERGTAAMETLMVAKSLEKALEVQGDYVKSSYEGFVVEATKIGELCTDLAKETCRPFENAVGKTAAKI
ncbi:MAG: phasin family protein [Proteobacteria bacterium]|nr:phasin family protein [Pseudomonadota bacterium]